MTLMILTQPYTHKPHLLFDSLHILRQLLYCACSVFRLDFRLYQFLIFKHRGNLAL